MEKQTTIIIIWIIFALVSGISEGILFHKKKANVIWKGQDIHVWFTFVRIFVTVILCLFAFIPFVKPIEIMITAIVFITIFPFFHDGMYYTTREILKKGTYPKMWFSSSWNNQTNAVLSFDPKERVILFLIAILILFFQYILC